MLQQGSTHRRILHKEVHGILQLGGTLSHGILQTDSKWNSATRQYMECSNQTIDGILQSVGT
jgi:hypothetical protein